MILLSFSAVGLSAVPCKFSIDVVVGEAPTERMYCGPEDGLRRSESASEAAFSSPAIYATKVSMALIAESPP